MYLLGFDLGSSSVKASILEIASGKKLSSAFSPSKEMKITAVKPGWAEQDPAMWWENLVKATREVLRTSRIQPSSIEAIGISYQMHGLVMVDKHMDVLRPSIIWCDSRAVEIGNKAFLEMGAAKILPSLLNSPGNFTASKLKWVKDNEPELYSKIWKIMLPGDYAAMRMTGEVFTTASGLSEGIMWDFNTNQVASEVLDYYGFSPSLIPHIVPTFATQGKLTAEAARELGLVEGIPVAYRAGDQPNNAFSLNVLNPGEIAATAGTSGVVYGVSSETRYDPHSRVNTFAHVNHTHMQSRLGVLLCINGTGILNSWLRKTMFETYDYEAINEQASEVPIGSEGLRILPFGNGAERMLGNINTGCTIANLNFNIHRRRHFARAAQEGIIFSFKYGMDIMETLGIKPTVIRAGMANMFLSPVFRHALADLTGASIELYNTDGSQGAARGAGIGAGIYRSAGEAFGNLEKLASVHPVSVNLPPLHEAYQDWLEILNRQLK